MKNGGDKLEINQILTLCSIFVIFLLICILGEFLKFIEQKKDKKNLMQLEQECPDMVLEFTGKVKSCVKIQKIIVYINDEKRVLEFEAKEIKPEEKYLTLYSDDDFKDHISTKETSGWKPETFKLRLDDAFYSIVAECDDEEIHLRSDKEYKKHHKIDVIRNLGDRKFSIKPDGYVPKIADKDISPEIQFLLRNEKDIRQYRDDFEPNVFIDCVISAVLTLFVFIVGMVLGLY